MDKKDKLPDLDLAEKIDSLSHLYDLDEQHNIPEFDSESGKEDEASDLYNDLEEFPLLEDIVQTGDPDIIESSRQAFEQTETDSNDSESQQVEETESKPIGHTITAEQLEELVDDIIKTHTENMRRDILEAIKQMLEHNPVETDDRL